VSIRISSVGETAQVITLKVEGALLADWVPVLEGACAGPLRGSKRVELDFQEVSFLDRHAVTVVRELMTRGVSVLRPSPLVRDLLWGIDEL
jgi:hypothetical protein